MSQLQNPPLKEIWRPVIGYEGKYEVSNLGNVVSLNYRRTGKRKLMILCKNTNGYLYVTLTNEGKEKNLKVHRLVALAFIPNPDNKPHIDHIDGVKTNNHIQNLRWCTQKENLNFPLAKENFSKANKGEKHTEESKAKIGKAHKGKIISDETRTKMSKSKLEVNSINQIFKRIKEAGDYLRSIATFYRVYKDQTHKDHQMVLDLVKKYTII